MKKTLLTVICLALSIVTFGAELYVSQSTGKKKGPGTKDAPFKSITDAVKKAAPGDTIKIAEGNYSGLLGASEIIIDKPVILIGGFAPDFSARDIAKHTTKIQPPNEKNDSKGLGVITLKLPNGAGPDMIIDGLVIDQSFMNSYHDTKGKPEGVETGMWLEPPAKGSKDLFASAKSYSIYSESASRYEGNIVITNCVFSNSGNYAINISLFKGKVTVINNVFVACRMISCNVLCSNAQAGTTSCEFSNNTVLFSWSRTSEFTDMGYGYRCNAKVESNVHHNIFGLSIFAGIDNAMGDPKTKKVSIDNNVFFLNKRADVTVVKSPSILSLRVDSDEFEDMADFPGMESVEDNVSLKDPAVFKGIINEAYLTAFLNASYSEKTDYDENSPANVFRAAMGMNKVGKIETKVSMYGNRYPLDETFKLFGASDGVGAQAIKY
ncbi:MAG: right-handed parallel beta-helix repeat-containing protein [Victivallales bacterium]|nr:right-handed parallel beta-helix repeat-containing protein [Victivallales bacterium]